jgi:hypothetical protein
MAALLIEVRDTAAAARAAGQPRPGRRCPGRPGHPLPGIGASGLAASLYLRTGRTAQHPRVRALRVGLPARYPCCLRGCARAAPRTPSGRPGSKGRRDAGQSPTASLDAVVQGRSPRRAAASGGRRTRRFGRPGVLRPVTSCPPGRPSCRPSPGNFPGMAQRRALSYGIRIRGPAAPGGEASSPARRYHSHSGTQRGPAGSWHSPACFSPFHGDGQADQPTSVGVRLELVPKADLHQPGSADAHAGRAQLPDVLAQS